MKKNLAEHEQEIYKELHNENKKYKKELQNKQPGSSAGSHWALKRRNM